MSKKRKTDPRPPKVQLQDYVLDGIYWFENMTGLRVTSIEIERKRPIGFGRDEVTTINIITE